MPRLNKPTPEPVKEVKSYVTLIGDIIPNENWNIPENLRVDETNPRTDTGIIQLEIEGKPSIISRSGLNLGIDADLVPAIIDALADLGFTSDFQILETGENDGTQPEHYTKSDYAILQAKIAPSPYLVKFNPNLTVRYPK
jgi:hypothetical protein